MSDDRTWCWVAAVAGGVVLGWLWIRKRRRHGFGDVTEPEPEVLRRIVGRSAAVQAMKERIKKFAPSASPVLVVGETGTGKELVADALQALSPRVKKPYHKVNMAAIQESLTSELFGHVKGSFSGAYVDRPGIFRNADGGTLFLDEIGDTPKSLQAALLRAIEQGEIKPVGADRSEKVNVRVIAATNRDLEQEVAVGNFRPDLYQRLKALQVSVPPLRFRKEDIPKLALNFAKRIARDMSREDVGWSDEVARRLQAHDWREGNIRDLRNTIEAAIALTPPGGHVAEYLNLPTALPSPGVPRTLAERIAQFEREQIQNELAVSKTVEEAAQRLGIDYATLWRKKKRYGLAELEGCLSSGCDL